MACNKCSNYSDPCNECNPCVEGDTTCNCPAKDMSTDCSVYTGDDLECSGITQNTILTTVIQNLDTFICNTRDSILAYVVQVTTLLNIGGGAEVFKQANGLGNKELRTIISGDLTLADVVQSADTIDVVPGTPSMTHVNDILRFIVTTVGGATEFASIDLSEYDYDTFVQSASFDDGTQILTIVRNNGEPDITVDLGFLNNHVESGVYNAGADTITLTLTDATTVDINLATLVSEILADAAAAQVQSDYLETSAGSKAFIVNKNPEKSVTLGVAGSYSVVDGDNNYIIEIDNGANDVTIDFTSITLTSNYFVGFVQKGTGLVTFTGADIIPLDSTNELYGQGKNAAISIINSTKYLQGQLKFA